MIQTVIHFFLMLNLSHFPRQTELFMDTVIDQTTQNCIWVQLCEVKSKRTVNISAETKTEPATGEDAFIIYNRMVQLSKSQASCLSPLHSGWSSNPQTDTPADKMLWTLSTAQISCSVGRTPFVLVLFGNLKVQLLKL